MKIPDAKKTQKRKKHDSKSPSQAQAPVIEANAVVGDSASAQVARRLLDKRPPLTATLRSALRGLATDAQRSELGRQTKARGVLADGVTMAVTVDQLLATFPSLAETYAPARFAYFLESLLALDALLAASTARETKLGAARGIASTGYERAAKARRKLLKRLNRFAGKREAEQQTLSALPAQGRRNEALRQAIEKAVALAEEWLSRKDAASAAHAELAALDAAVIEEARKAAAALDEANVDAALEGRKSSHDSPLVNLEEGNVLLEMAYAMDVLDEAHEDNDVVPRLVPGPATRHALVSSRRPGAEPAAEAPAEPKTTAT